MRYKAAATILYIGMSVIYTTYSILSIIFRSLINSIEY